MGGHEKVMILFCGRLIHKKGLFLLLDVVRKLQVENWELVICGDGELKERLKERIDELNLKDKVMMKGAVPYSEISRIYEEADIFVLPSLRESGGSVLIEAMAHGLPIVSFNMALSKVLKEHQTGIFIDTFGSKEEVLVRYANELKELIENPSLRQKLGENGYQYVNTELTWEIMLNKVYGSLLRLPKQQG